MEPTIHIKEFIVISEEKDYKVNDIVTYRDPNGNLVTHRITKIEESFIITRGDNNTIDDEPISLEAIQGKVIYHSIVLGEIFLYWLKPILSIIVFITLLNNLIGIIINRKEKEKNEIN